MALVQSAILLNTVHLRHPLPLPDNLLAHRESEHQPVVWDAHPHVQPREHHHVQKAKSKHRQRRHHNELAIGQVAQILLVQVDPQQRHHCAYCTQHRVVKEIRKVGACRVNVRRVRVEIERRPRD